MNLKNPFVADFPALTQKVRGKKLIYLDSAATALKPWSVIERVGHFLTYEASNIHRGAHYLAAKATGEYEATREKTKGFINAAQSEEIIFTKGTTESLNLIVSCFGGLVLKKNDLVILTEMEHHANIVPWQMLQQQVGFNIEVIKVLENGELDLESYKDLLKKGPKIVSVTHCSNTLGTINPVKEITTLAKQIGCYVVIDGAQMVANHSVDVQDIGCDFYVFSAHKLFGPYGVGVAYGRRELLEQMSPYQGGGSMISTVKFSGTTFNDVPFRFEAGTPNIEGVLGFASALDYINQKGFSAIEKVETDLLVEATERLSQIKNLKILGSPVKKAAILSFYIEGLHSNDIGEILDQEGVAVRVGTHCTMPLMERFGVRSTIRASFSVYNQSSDIDVLVNALKKAQEMLS